MREIKFRARHKVTGEWFYGSSLWLSFDDTTSNYELPLSTFWQQVERGWLDRETTGQYTGLKDKNGVEIYEGDILVCRCGGGADGCWSCRHNLNEKNLVYWNEDVVAFCLKYHREPVCKRMKREEYEWCYIYDTATHEVIRNIYENPELKD